MATDRVAKRVKGAAACLALAVFAQTAWGAAGRSGAILLRAPFGARPFALGQAYSALGDDIFAMQFNPAALTRLKDSQAAAQFSQSIVDTQYGYVAIASPLNPNQALGLGVAYMDAGKADLFDANGNQTASVSAKRDLMGQLSYAYSFGLAPGRLHVGASGKFIQSTLLEQSRASAYAGDLGALYERPWLGGTAALAAGWSNLGPGIRYSGGMSSGSEADPLPRTARLAAAYSRDVFAADTVALGIEVDQLAYDDNTYKCVGLEYSYHQLLALRIGYRLRQGAGDFTMGIGLNYRNFSLDYGIGLVQEFNAIQQFSLNYRFTIPGIRYRDTRVIVQTPLQTAVQEVEKDIKDQRFFDALSGLKRLDALFPNSPEAPRLKNELHREIEHLAIYGSPAKRQYAAAFGDFEQSRWERAANNLQIYLSMDREGAGLGKYLAEAQAKAKEEEDQQRLRLQARIGTLYELADQAFTAGDSDRALKIIDEILRLGPYEPAETLRARVHQAAARPEAKRAKKNRQAALKRKLTTAAAETGSAAHPPSARDAAAADRLYYQALRDFADDKLDDSLRELHEAERLNPDIEGLRSAFERIEAQLKERSKALRQQSGE